jgi:hypothetical protein
LAKGLTVDLESINEALEEGNTTPDKDISGGDVESQ